MSLDAVKILMKEAGTGWLATCSGNRATLRPMGAWLWDGDDLVFATFRNSAKVSQIAQNPGVELGFSAPDWVHVRINGTMKLADDAEAAKRLYDANPPLQQMFESHLDPKFAVLRMRVGSIRYFSMEKLGYESVDLS